MPSADRPLSSILDDIAGNLQTMVRAEFRLAKTEVGEEVGKAATAGVFIGLGALMLAFSALFALLALTYALSTVMPVWAAALIVAAGEGLVAALLIGIGIKRFKAARMPPKTVQTMKENVEWAKQLTK
jgi:uncharacterized membrane protein YqjE